MKEIILLLGLSIFIPQAKASNNFDDIKFLYCYDGDTCKFNINNINPLFGEKIGIRLNGIDTAEIKTKDNCEKIIGLKARDYVNNILDNAEKIELKNCIRGKYFRLVCNIIYDGSNLKNNLLELNYGYEYYGKTKEKINWCK